MTRFVLAVCCALLALPAWTQIVPLPRAKPLAGPACPLQPGECQINASTFDFGRGQMSTEAPPINGFGTISVTCTRTALAEKEGIDVQIQYLLKAVPAAPSRQMRDNELRFLRYDMFLDPARTRYWGDGLTNGTFAIQGALFLDDRNRIGTLVHQLYGQVDGAQVGVPGQWLGLVGVALQYNAFCAGNARRGARR